MMQFLHHCTVKDTGLVSEEHTVKVFTVRNEVYIRDDKDKVCQLWKG